MIFFDKTKRGELWLIVYRNVALLTNGIIFLVVILLFLCGQTRAAIFLGFISLLNMVIGTAQDLHSWLNLERLQSLTAPRVIRLNADRSQQSVLTEEILKGDIILLKTGDQVPCDSVLIETLGLEINESLITGESNSLPRKTSDHLLGGSIITAGSGKIQTETVFLESRIARMTSGLKGHSLKASPIQQSANLMIRYAGYTLIASIAFVIVRGVVVHEPLVNIILNIGTLASMLVPQGLVFTITIFFAYGAANLFQKHVLLQEINATEKLGRIKNLCMDKTGTLTENSLSVENMHLPTGMTQARAAHLMTSYINGTHDESQTILAVQQFLHESTSSPALEIQPFSAWRRYGAARIDHNQESIAVIVGSSDALLPHITSKTEKKWLEKLVAENARAGKHVLCVTRCETQQLQNDLSDSALSVVAVFVFHNNMREGIGDTVNFFQDRGVRIRILTGDNAETAVAVATAAGILHPDAVITGKEMETWSVDDFDHNVDNYTIFARIVPEQKEHIIDALKKNGFTAMVGDGANDALAIKKADLGIALFDGAPATRQLAAIVLVNNSFSALPRGVELADDIIRNVEIFSSIFFNQTIMGLFLFILASLLGHEYPLTPFNITFINYFTIGIPGLLISYWTLRPSAVVPPVRSQVFLKRILPFATWSALVQTIGIGIVFTLNAFFFHITPPNTLVSLVFIALCYAFFLYTPMVYHTTMSKTKSMQLVGLSIAACVLLYTVFHIPFLMTFFTISAFHLALSSTLLVLLVIGISWIVQYAIARHYAKK